MKTKLFLSLTLSAFILTTSAFAAPKSKITIERAQEIALKNVGGEVASSDTVMRHKKPLYSVFVKGSDGVTTHFLISDKGKIKRRAAETPDAAKIK